MTFADCRLMPTCRPIRISQVSLNITQVGRNSAQVSLFTVIISSRLWKWEYDISKETYTDLVITPK